MPENVKNLADDIFNNILLQFCSINVDAFLFSYWLYTHFQRQHKHFFT